MKRFAFVMDPLAKLDLPWDTSLSLLRELCRRGHQTVWVDPSSVALEGDCVRASSQRVHPLDKNRYRQDLEKDLSLATFDVVLIRKDPPFDSGYLALTYLLEPLALRTAVINHPRGIRNANEKLFGLVWNQWSPPTLVSADARQILAFQKSLGEDLVIKPLYEKGGKGVFLLNRNAPDREALLGRATSRQTQPVVAQQFIPVPKGSGDKRILLWKGEILGAFERIPTKGEFRSNLSLGGRFARTDIAERERKLVRALKPTLLKEGLFFVGIDVRSGFLIEVNVTSPAGLVELDRLYGRATEKLADSIEKL